MLASIRSFAKQLQAVPSADLTENLYVAHAASDCPTNLSTQNLRILISIKSENIYEVKFGDRATVIPVKYFLRTLSRRSFENDDLRAGRSSQVRYLAA